MAVGKIHVHTCDEEAFREAASSLVLADARCSSLPPSPKTHVDWREVQSASPHFSLHLQRHCEGYSLWRETSPRLDPGTPDGPASDSTRSGGQGSGENADDAGIPVWQSDDVCRDPEFCRGQSRVHSRVQGHAPRILAGRYRATPARRSEACRGARVDDPLDCAG